MGTNLTAAHHQWATRPADERFWTLSDMRAACETSRVSSRTARAPWASLSAIAAGGDVKILGNSGIPAGMTHYAFSQVCASAGAPASYLRTLPADVAANALNTSMRQAGNTDRDLLFHVGESLTLRSMLSEKYDRVWDSDVCEMLESLDGWRAPAGRAIHADKARPATAEDLLPGQINIAPGDLIGPSGLYASDHDMFAFLVAPDRVISDGRDGALMRGVMVRNSEVGDASLSVTFFLCQAICGNHIVWNATGVHDIRVRHVGDGTARRAFRGFEAELRRYRDDAADEERGIVAARSLVLGTSKAEVLDAIAKYARSHSLPLSRKTIEQGIDTAEQFESWYGNPRSLWGVVCGLTHASQGTSYADDRANIDRAAGKLLSMAF